MQLLDDVLKTYEVLVDALEKNPTVNIEIIFDEQAVWAIKQEYEKLKSLKEILE